MQTPAAWLWATLFTLHLCLLTAAVPAKAELQPGQPIPAFRVVSTTGQSISSEDFKNQVLLIDFFASWCQACKKSVPVVMEMNRKYGRQGLQVIGLSVDESERPAAEFAKMMGISYPVALAVGKLAETLDMKSVPFTILVSRQGTVFTVLKNYSVDSVRHLEWTIKTLITEK